MQKKECYKNNILVCWTDRFCPHTVLLLHDFKVQLELVDGDLVAPRKILHGAGQERVGEVEPGQPKHRRHPITDPLLKE